MHILKAVQIEPHVSMFLITFLVEVIRVCTQVSQSGS
jgi:hypothetical protein